VENAGILSASGLIAVKHSWDSSLHCCVYQRSNGQKAEFWTIEMFQSIASWLAIPIFAVLALYLIYVPLSKAGRADEPAPPTAMM